MNHEHNTEDIFQGNFEFDLEVLHMNNLHPFSNE